MPFRKSCLCEWELRLLESGGHGAYSHFKKRWKTFSAPNASYSKKYLSQFFIKMTIIIKTDAKSLSLVGVKGHFYHVRVKLSTLNANYLLLPPAFCLQSVSLQLNMILPLQIFCVSLENNQHTQGEC